MRKLNCFLLLSIVFVFLICFVCDESSAAAARPAKFKLTKSTTTTTTTTTAAAAAEDEDENDENDEKDAKQSTNIKADSKENENDKEKEPQTTKSSVANVTTSDSSTTGNKEDCAPPSINDFPTDLFTQRQRRFGAIVFHIAFAFYLYFCITRLCDDYFMSSLEIISEV